MCKHVSLQRLYIVYNMQCLKEGIMNHNFPCTPEGGKISQFYHACSTLTNQVARFEVSKSLIHLVIGV